MAAPREPAKSTSSEARNVDEKWQKQQDQRAIQSKEINNGSYLVTCGSPAVHLVSLCLICGHLWCALSRSSHLVHLLRVQTTICAPFLLTQGARPLALPAAGRRCRQAASQSPPQGGRVTQTSNLLNLGPTQPCSALRRVVILT